MTLTSGTRLGPYEILSALGAGGMGEVYRAHDSKLNRDVAIKVLPEALARDPDRLARFGREEQVLAALNHPNIAHIHGFEDSTGVAALVIELVEGPTLAEKLEAQRAKGSPLRASGASAWQAGLPLDEALPIARQIAEALEAAHEKGIIHRDLKPANIKVREDGTVKVLDFGLAKLLSPVETGHHGEPSGVRLQADLTHSPTLASPPMMTGVGAILGTAAYMSPGQARGKSVDAHTDLWAFGCVLYEMLTGRRAFPGESVTDTLSAVISKDPAWEALPQTTPAAVRRLLRRCLMKDRKQRLASASDARLEIEDGSTRPQGPRPKRIRTRPGAGPAEPAAHRAVATDRRSHQGVGDRASRLAAERAGQSGPLHARAMDRSHPVPRQSVHPARYQCRRAGAAGTSRGPQESLRLEVPARDARRGALLHPVRVRETHRRRSARVSAAGGHGRPRAARHRHAARRAPARPRRVVPRPRRLGSEGHHGAGRGLTFDEAVSTLDKAAEMSGRHTLALTGLAGVFGQTGNVADAFAVHRELMDRVSRGYVSPSHLALTAAAAGLREEALAFARRAWDEREPSFILWARHFPQYRTLHSYPRFAAILREMDSPE